MKKKIYGIVLINIMAMADGWNFNKSTNEVNLSDLTLVNVEALALSEKDYDKKIWERHSHEDNSRYGC